MLELASSDLMGTLNDAFNTTKFQNSDWLFITQLWVLQALISWYMIKNQKATYWLVIMMTYCFQVQKQTQ